jgi:hypothetical protein
MDGDERPGPGGDRRLDPRRIERVAAGIDIHEDRPRARVADGGGRGDEGERRGDDLVSRAHPRSEEREVECAGSRVHRDGVRRAAVVRELRLEVLDLAPEDVGCVRENARDRLLDLFPDFPILSSEIDERNHTPVLTGARTRERPRISYRRSSLRARATSHPRATDKGAPGARWRSLSALPRCLGRNHALPGGPAAARWIYSPDGNRGLARGLSWTSTNSE